MNRLPPHPLVIGLAATEDDKDAVEASRLAATAAELAAKLDPPAGVGPALYPPNVDRFSVSTKKPDYILFAGYLGGFADPPPHHTRLLYLDAKLATWLILPRKDIVLHNRVKDDTAAFGLRDVLWVKSHARVVQGEAAESVQQRFLSGPFTRAADVAGPPFVAEGASGDSGLLCEAVTPGCCGYITRHRP
jgi:hypothetical protein